MWKLETNVLVNPGQSIKKSTATQLGFLTSSHGPDGKRLRSCHSRDTHSSAREMLISLDEAPP